MSQLNEIFSALKNNTKRGENLVRDKLIVPVAEGLVGISTTYDHYFNLLDRPADRQRLAFRTSVGWEIVGHDENDAVRVLDEILDNQCVFICGPYFAPKISID